MLYSVKVSGTGGKGLNIREKPNSNSDTKILGVIEENGWTFTVNGKKGDWYKLAKQPGWVHSGYTTLVANLDPSTGPVDVKQPEPTAELNSTPPPINYVPTNEVPYDAKLSKRTSVITNASLGNSDVQEIDRYISQLVGDGSLNKSYYNNYDFVRNSLNTIHKNHNLLNNVDQINKIRNDMFNKFNRYKAVYPDIELTKSFGYVFFVRPNINVFQEGGPEGLVPEVYNDPSFRYLNKNNKLILASLCKRLSSTHDFHPLLSNHAMSFEIQDEFIKSEEVGETFTGYSFKYAKNDIESKTAGSFTIQFSDDYNLNVYKTIKTWISYASNVYRGEFKPRKSDTVSDKILDYAGAVYYFLCGPDGETIIFWSKYFGIFPTTAPSSTFSWSKGNFLKLPEFSVSFDYTSKEDFNPLTIYEFNNNSKSGFIYKRMHEMELMASGISMAGAPFIETVYEKGTGEYSFKLKFRPNDN